MLRFQLFAEDHNSFSNDKVLSFQMLRIKAYKLDGMMTLVKWLNSSWMEKLKRLERQRRLESWKMSKSWKRCS
jgi:hypothetical protein